MVDKSSKYKGIEYVWEVNNIKEKVSDKSRKHISVGLVCQVNNIKGDSVWHVKKEKVSEKKKECYKESVRQVEKEYEYRSCEKSRKTKESIKGV